jgi:hypothetical protein
MADDLGPTLPAPGEAPEGGAAGALTPPAEAAGAGAVKANTTPPAPQPTAEPDTTEMTGPPRGEDGSRAAPDGPTPA